MRLLRNPKAYCAWALIVLVSLGVAYQVDPYIFGFVSLALAWATGAVGVIGFVAVVLSKAASGRSKVAVCTALLLAGLAVAASLKVLSGFNWA